MKVLLLAFLLLSCATPAPLPKEEPVVSPALPEAPKGPVETPATAETPASPVPATAETPASPETPATADTPTPPPPSYNAIADEYLTQWLTPEPPSLLRPEPQHSAVVVVVTAPTPAPQSATTIANVTTTPYCEAPGPHYKDFRMVGFEGCAKACAEDEGCAAFTHISGWQHCFLKAKKQGKTKIRFYSGLKKAAGQYEPQGYDLDFPGKDLRLEKSKDWASCAAICDAEQACVGYGYMEGIARCWLKSGVAKPQVKVFTCGQKG